MPFVSVRALSKSFGATRVLDKINLEAKEGEFVVFFGPNGCGKTTLLHVLAGLERPDSGSALIGGRLPGESRVGFVFQNFHESLFPYRTLRGNVEFGPEVSGKPGYERA